MGAKVIEERKQATIDQILGLIPCILDTKRQKENAEIRAQAMRSQLKVFADPIEARDRVFSHSLRYEQELQMKSLEEQEVESAESEMFEVSSENSFASFIPNYVEV